MIRKILLNMIVLSVIVWANFSRDDIKQIVTDSTTGLQWQDDANVSRNWIQAIDYCEALSLGGYTDWRLPNFNELYYLADRSKVSPAINSTFQNVVSYSYWSSTTTLVPFTIGAWNVFFGDGSSDNLTGKSISYYVRCVRGGQ